MLTTNPASSFIPPIFAGLSFVYLGLKFSYGRRLDHTIRDSERGAKASDLVNALLSGLLSETTSLKQLDGATILTFRFLRFLLVIALLALQVFDVNSRGYTLENHAQLFFLIYTSALGILTITAESPQWRDITSRHLALLLLTEFSVYGILDVWPYAIQSPRSFKDLSHDLVTWTRFTLLFLSAVLIPLVMPRPFRPLIPGAAPGANEIASLLSRATYTFLDQIIFYAWRVPDVGLEDLPSLPYRESIEALSYRGMRVFDPLLLIKKRHAIWGFFEIWGHEYFMAFFWIFLHALAEFIGVLGTRNLLSYLETGISSYGVQPWVWIILLGFGPFISACILTQYYYVGTRIELENLSFVTYLVFHHSIRIRIRSDNLAKKREDREDETDSACDTNTQSSASLVATDDETLFDGSATDSEPVPEDGYDKERAGAMVGNINNLVTSDLSTIEESYRAVEIPSLVLQIIISVVVLYWLLGWSAMVGFGIMLILTPIPTYVGQLLTGVQREKMKMTDKRVEAVTQSLSVLRMLKLFAWESYMLKELAQRRFDELMQMQKGRLLEIAMSGVNTTLPLIAKVTTFSIYALVSNGELYASRVVSALLVFSMLEEQLYHVTRVIPQIIKAKVSYDRYTDFLNNTELLESEEQKSEILSGISPMGHDKDAIGFVDCSFSWDSFKNPGRLAGHKKRKAFCLRFDGQVLFHRDKINLIVGPTASGKTSVLMALLGEMHYKAHDINSWYNLPRDGGVAYAAQESWVLNETIRENIIFGEPFDEERYKKTLHSCALELDLNSWEAGDLTEVGERGLTLSGGQKARVTLARALYSHAAVILLDDVLAALDVHTAKWIVDKALRGDLVKGRTVLLVTHNIALAAPIASYVVLLSKDGTVAARGAASDVLNDNTYLRAKIEKAHEEGGDVDASQEEIDVGKIARLASGKLVVMEEKAIGHVEIAAFLLFLKGIGGLIIWASFFFVLTTAVLANVAQMWFIGFVSTQYETHNPMDIPVLKYLVFYALLNLISDALDCLSQAIWSIRSLRASRIIHNKLLESIFTATFRWLDITPAGRIIARCTQDIDNIDTQFESLPFVLMRMTIRLIVQFTSAVLITGWFALVPGLLLAVLAGFLGLVYLKCQLCIRREMSNAKAPVMSQIDTALCGLPSIRAYRAQDRFSTVLKARIDTLARASYTYFDINRWIGVRIDSLGGILMASVSTYLVYSNKISAGTAGFTISVVLGFSRDINWWIRIYNYIEIQANSLERVLGFLRIDHEPQSSNENLPPAYWPSSGSLRVKNLSARYSDDSPDVLRNLSFEIAAGERVGIVGRTGAGKSSIALALLRVIKTSGEVFYDNIAIDKINLDSLRTNITLIPQHPELIQGTLRTNLDPFGNHEDAELNDALRVAGLFNIRDTIDASQNEAQSSINSKSAEGQQENQAHIKIGLDTMVESGGTNFSLGQRQIIALARAIVRRSKLLIFDEATAAIDYDTDSMIQGALRNEFSADTTFITVAHRLRTIMDYDRIIVMEAGKLVEFDTPKNLLDKKEGYLRAMVDESEEKETLIALANMAATG